MQQIQKVIINLQLIELAMLKVSQLTNDFHSTESNEPIIQNFQTQTMDFFNELTLKIEYFKDDIYSNLEGMNVLFEEDYAFLKAAQELINAPD